MTFRIATATPCSASVLRLLATAFVTGLMGYQGTVLAGEGFFVAQKSQPNAPIYYPGPVEPQRYQPQIEPPPMVEELSNGALQSRAARTEGETIPLLHLELPPPAATAVAEKMSSKESGKKARKIGFNRRLAEFLEPSLTRSRYWRWQTLANGEQITRLQVSSPGALALRIGIGIENLPLKAELRFFSGASGQGRAYRVKAENLLRIVGSGQNGGDRAEESVYWSPTLEGDQAIVEIRVESQADVDKVSLEIRAVSHLIVDPKQSAILPQDAAASCNLDVNCYNTKNQSGADIANAVARMIFTSGQSSYACTGTLLADRAHSNIPFFLTARHCISTAAEAASLETTWFYASASCNSTVQAGNVQSRSGGASLLETYVNNDMTLLRLNEQPPAGVVYAGWDWNAKGENYTMIHHPEGDWKKISFGVAQEQYRCDSASSGQLLCRLEQDGAYFRMFIDRGFSEEGSSGSGVFKENAYLVGTLTAGSGACNAAYGMYGRFKVSYESGINKWLDNNHIRGNLENPQPGSYQSGITVISGWACVPSGNPGTPEIQKVAIEIDGKPATLPTSYGTSRADTQSVCGDVNNGFSLLVNMNVLGSGVHTVRALADGNEIGRASFTVTTLGVEYLRGATGIYKIADFPGTGQSVLLQWQENLQNFVISARNAPALPAQHRQLQPVISQKSLSERPLLAVDTLSLSPAATAAGYLGYLENPQPTGYQSGIAVFSGWACRPGLEINRVDLEIDGTLWQAGYGTERLDTVGVCGDANNGWGLLFNTNLLGDGQHTVRALVDGVELGQASFSVATLGGDFLRGLKGDYRLMDFPKNGDSVVILWQESLQNFTIREANVR